MARMISMTYSPVERFMRGILVYAIDNFRMNEGGEIRDEYVYETPGITIRHLPNLEYDDTFFRTKVRGPAYEIIGEGWKTTFIPNTNWSFDNVEGDRKRFDQDMVALRMMIDVVC